MTIIDIGDEHFASYLACLEDWSDDMKEAGPHKQRWFERMKDRGLRVKLALTEDGKACGMIQYLPIEHSPAQGSDIDFVLCIWVHGHKKGVGNQQKKGIGKALLAAAEEDARNRGAQAMAAWGLSLPFWMKAAWFKKQGYKKADKQGIQTLMWKPFSPQARPPRWVREIKRPGKEEGQVTVTGFVNGWCPAQNTVFERAKRASGQLGDRVFFREYDTSDPSVFAEWGISDGLFIDGRPVRTGPPPSFEKIKKKIARRVKKLA